MFPLQSRCICVFKSTVLIKEGGKKVGHALKEGGKEIGQESEVLGKKVKKNRADDG